MRNVELLREQIQQLVARQLGQDARAPRDFTGQLRISGVEADLLALPDLPDSAIDGIITDPLSPFFGRRRFLAGVSRLDGDDVIA